MWIVVATYLPFVLCTHAGAESRSVRSTFWKITRYYHILYWKCNFDEICVSNHPQPISAAEPKHMVYEKFVRLEQFYKKFVEKQTFLITYKANVINYLREMQIYIHHEYQLAFFEDSRWHLTINIEVRVGYGRTSFSFHIFRLTSEISCLDRRIYIYSNILFSSSRGVFF